MRNSQIHFISASALAKKFGISPQEMFVYLKNKGMIEKNGEVWSLTIEGKAAGGRYIAEKRCDNTIVWPEDIKLEVGTEKLVTLEEMEKHYHLKHGTLVKILEQIEWLYRIPNGYMLLPKGLDAGGLEGQCIQTGRIQSQWPKSTVYDKELCQMVLICGGEITEKEYSIDEDLLRYSTVQCHELFCTLDGHHVTSEAEVIVDNYLYEKRISHAFGYIHENNLFASNFYLPAMELYIDILKITPNQSMHSQKIEYYSATNIEYIELSIQEAKAPRSTLDDVINQRGKKKLPVSI